jgi:predicted transposase/invertase (TIGR01784 family)
VEHIRLVRQKVNLPLTDKFGFVIIELPKFTKEKGDLSTLQDKWLYSLKNMEQLSEYPGEMKEDIFRDLYRKAAIDNLTEKEMKTYQKSVLEYDDVILSMDYVRSQSLEIGEKRGISIGEKRGIEKERIKFVRNCYKRNMSIAEIAELTDLKVEQISDILHG